MRWLLLAVLTAGVVEARPGRFSRTNPRCESGRSTRGTDCAVSSGAYFEFAPASGAGMTAACACTAPTGAKGEALTFTRASNGTCSKQGLATTGIANGDFVVCSTDQPRVEPSGGVSGLLVETSRTNLMLRSQEIDHVTWLSNNAGVAAPSVTANAGVAPDGTTTAERVVFPACPAVGNLSVKYQSTSPANGTYSQFLYARSFLDAGTQTFSVCKFGTGGACHLCTTNSNTWTQCSSPNNVYAGGGAYIVFGCENDTANYTDGGNTGAADVLVWGTQQELGTYPTSYIPTTNASVTRATEVPYVTITPLAAGPGCISATLQAPWSTAPWNARVLRVDNGGSDDDRFELFVTSGAKTGNSLVSVATSAQTVTTAASGTWPGTNRLLGWRTASTTQAATINTSQTTAATALGAFPGTMGRVYLGRYAPLANFEPSGIITRVEVDPSATRCTP